MHILIVNNVPCKYVHSVTTECYFTFIGVRDQFRLGGLRSVARIFSPLLARKSSGFARILTDFFFARIWLFSKFQGGGAPPPPPPPRTPMFTLYKVEFVHPTMLLQKLCEG